MLIDDVLEDLRAEKISVDAALGEIRRRVSESAEALDLPTLYDRVDQSQQKGLQPSHARQIRLCLDGAVSAMEHRYQEQDGGETDEWGDDELELTLEPIEESKPYSDQDGGEDGDEVEGGEPSDEVDEDEDSGLELPRIRPEDPKPTAEPQADDSADDTAADNLPGNQSSSTAPPADEAIPTGSERPPTDEPDEPDEPSSESPEDEHEVILETRSSIPSSSERFGPEMDEQAFQTTMVGALLGGRFELLNRVSQDPYGTVYRARDHESTSDDAEAQLCGIRVLPSKLAKQDAIVKRVEAVIRRTKRLKHPNLLTDRTLYQDGDQAWIVSPLPPGGTMARFIRRECVKGLPPERALAIVRDLAEGLHAAHQEDMAHGDLKPASIFIGEKDQVVIADFGLRMALYGKKPPVGQAGSTEIEQMDPIDAYLTVEAMEGNPPHPSDDVYALACITATLLSGGHPFNGQSGLRRLEKDLKPPRLKGLSGHQNKILRQGMGIYQSERPESVMAFLADLETRRGELPKKQIGIAVAVVVALAASWVPIQSWLDHREQQAQIAELQEMSWPEVRGELRLLDEDSLDRMRADLEPYISPRFAQAVEEQLNADDPIEARTLLDEGRGYFPDASELEDLREPVAEARGRLEAEAAGRLSSRLETGELEVRDDGRDVPGLVRQLEHLVPGHELTDRDALRVQYISAIRETANSPDRDRAYGLKRAVADLFPEDDEIIEMARQALGQAEGRRATLAMEEIAPRLEAQLPPGDLSDVNSLSSDWIELLQMTGSHPLLEEHQEAVTSILEQELERLMDDGAWEEANEFLRAQAGLWASDSLAGHRRSLTRAQLADGYRPASLRAERRGLDERRAKVEALLEEGRMSPVWSGELILAWRDMLGWMRPGRDWLADLREEVAEVYLEAIEVARDNGDLERARNLAREALMMIPGDRQLMIEAEA